MRPAREALRPSFYEFFAGGGMARAGLCPRWDCIFANDFDPKKSRTYNLNWGDGALRTADVREIRASNLPGQADLVWASFPCQDLSLAGNGAGLILHSFARCFPMRSKSRPSIRSNAIGTCSRMRIWRHSGTRTNSDLWTTHMGFYTTDTAAVWHSRYRRAGSSS